MSENSLGNESHNAEYFRNFHYPKAPSLNKSQLFKRRIHQAFQILFSSHYKTHESLEKNMVQHYSQDEELKFYSQYAHYGFHENELEAFSLAQKKSGRVLVVGCGTGREIFALEKLGNFDQLMGIDLSLKMIEKAKSFNFSEAIDFRHNKIEKLSGKFDLIWVTAILESHIQGTKKRTEFFSHLKRLSSPDSKIVLTPQIKKLGFRNPHFWGSQLLRLRWSINKIWEPGDVLMANLGAHNKVDQLVYSHFYPTEENLKAELNEAGFAQTERLAQESWVIG